MDGEDHKKETGSSGHEGHGVHLCHRCGWPFPNPHPSARHRRAHKKVCGTIDGYKISEPKSEDTHLADSDTEHASDDDQPTPSPKIEKGAEERVASAGVGEKSTKSEDELFSDAVTEFSDAGVSPSLEERLEIIKEVDKSAEKSEVHDLYRNLSLEVVGETVEAPAPGNGLTSCPQTTHTEVPEAAKDLLESTVPLDNVRVEESAVLGTRNVLDVDSFPTQPKCERDVITVDGNYSEDSIAQKGPLSPTQRDNAEGGDKAEQGASDSITLDCNLTDAEVKSSTPDVRMEKLNELCKSMATDKEKHYPNPQPEIVECRNAFVEAKNDAVSTQCDDGIDQSKSAEVSFSDKGQENMHFFPANLPVAELPEIMIADFKDQNSLKSEFQGELGSSESITSVEDVHGIIVLEEGPSTANSVKDSGSSRRSFDNINGLEDDIRNGGHKVSLDGEAAALTLMTKGGEDLDCSGPESHPVASEAKQYNIQNKNDVKELESPSIDGKSTQNVEYSTFDSSDRLSVAISNIEEVKQTTNINEVEHENVINETKQFITAENERMDGKTKAVKEGLEICSTLGDNQCTIALREDDKHDGINDNIELLNGQTVTEKIATTGNLMISEEAMNKSAVEFSVSSGNLGASGGLVSTRSGSSPGRDNNPHEACQGLKDGDDIKVQPSVNSAGRDAGSSQDGDIVFDKISIPTAAKDPGSLSVDVEVMKDDAVNQLESVSAAPIGVELNHYADKSQEDLISEQAPLSIGSSCLDKSSAIENSDAFDITKTSESVTTDEVDIKLNHTLDAVELRKNSENSEPKEQETEPVDQVCDKESSDAIEDQHTNEGVTTSKSVGDVSGAELYSDGHGVAPGRHSADPSMGKPVLQDSEFDISNKSPTGCDEKHTADDVQSTSDIYDNGLNKQQESGLPVDISVASSSRTDSLEGNWGSVSVLSSQSDLVAVADSNSQVPEKSESKLEKPKAPGWGSHPEKSVDFEPPSFMTLVESGNSTDKKTAPSEIEAVHNSQQPKSEALQAGWFPSLTNVVNESQGRKKNEEIIAKVTNWSAVKPHNPLKSLLTEAKSPNQNQLPAMKQKDETVMKSTGAAVPTVNSILSSEAPKDKPTNKEMEEWNSPARYPVEIKKEKRKGKAYWVPFVCCSSVHRDL